MFHIDNVLKGLETPVGLLMENHDRAACFKAVAEAAAWTMRHPRASSGACKQKSLDLRAASWSMNEYGI